MSNPKKYLVVLVTSTKVIAADPHTAVDIAMMTRITNEKDRSVRREVHVYEGKKKVKVYNLSYPEKEEPSSSDPSPSVH